MKNLLLLLSFLFVFNQPVFAGLYNTGDIVQGTYAEKITNGDFASGSSSWTLGAQETYDSTNHAILYTGSNSPSTLAQTFGSLQASGWYLVSFDISNKTGSGTITHTFSVLDNVGATIASQSFSGTNGTKTVALYAYSIQSIRYVYITNQSNGVAATDNIDNVSFKLVTISADLFSRNGNFTNITISSGLLKDTAVTPVTSLDLINRKLVDASANSLLNFKGDGTSSSAVTLTTTATTIWNLLNALGNAQVAGTLSGVDANFTGQVSTTSGYNSGFSFDDRTLGGSFRWEWYATGGSARLYSAEIGNDTIYIDNSSGYANFRINNGAIPSAGRAGLSVGPSNGGTSSIQLTADSGSGGSLELVNGQHIQEIVEGSEVETLTYNGVGIFNHDPAYALDVNGSVHVVGKITSGGGYDPPYVLYDAKTRRELRDIILKEIPEEKRSGAVLFFNKDAHQLEMYIASEDKFYSVQNNNGVSLLTNILSILCGLIFFVIFAIIIIRNKEVNKGAL